MEWTPQNISLVIGAIGTAVTAFFSPRLVEAWSKYLEYRRRLKEDRMALLELERELEDTGLKQVIRRLDRQVRHLQQSCDKLTADHKECQESLSRERAEKAAAQTEAKLIREKWDSWVKRMGRMNTAKEGEGI